MTQEEKLEEAKRLYDTANADQRYVLESLFPELKESEDERMKKLCISVVKQFAAVCRKEDKYLPEVEKCIAWLEKQVEQKPAWSEEDKMMLQYAIEHFERQKRNCIEGGARKKAMQEFIDWLKSLKDRVQSQQEWSEEDNEMLNLITARLHSHPNIDLEEYSKEYDWLNYTLKSLRPQSQLKWSEEDEETLKDIITSMTNLKDSATSDALRDIYNSKIAWLKSLRLRSHWKPSEEQMKTLNEVINYCANGKEAYLNDYIYNRLIDLRDELNKL